MKMRVWNIIVIVILSLLLVALGAWVACVSLNVLSADWLVQVSAWLSAGWWQMAIGIAVGVVLFALGIKLFTIPFSKDEKAAKYAKIATTQMGEVIIAVDTIKLVVRKALESNNNILKALVFITNEPESIRISIKMAVKLDQISLPEMTAATQEAVREAVTTTTGIPVSAVQINIDNSVITNS